MFDDRKNFAYSTIITAPNPQASGTTLKVRAGEYALFAIPPFNAIAWPNNTNPTAANAEIVRVTAINSGTEVITIVRAQEGTSAKNIGVGWQFMGGLTDKTLTDIETAINNITSGYVPNTRTVAGHALSADVTLAKGDVGLGNVDNTSDATKNAASVTLINKTMDGNNNVFTNIAPAARTGGFFFGSTSISASGNKSITGVGFQPKAIIFLTGGLAGVASAQNAGISVGFATSSSSRGTVGSTTRQANGGTSTGPITTKAYSFSTVNSGGGSANINIEGDLVSMDADGFTINTTTFGVTTTLLFLCLG